MHRDERSAAHMFDPRLARHPVRKPSPKLRPVSQGMIVAVHVWCLGVSGAEARGWEGGGGRRSTSECVGYVSSRWRGAACLGPSTQRERECSTPLLCRLGNRGGNGSGWQPTDGLPPLRWFLVVTAVCTKMERFVWLTCRRVTFLLAPALCCGGRSRCHDPPAHRSVPTDHRR
jgi:hypothetical protein